MRVDTHPPRMRDIPCAASRRDRTARASFRYFSLRPRRRCTCFAAAPSTMLLLALSRRKMLITATDRHDAQLLGRIESYRQVVRCHLPLEQTGAHAIPFLSPFFEWMDAFQRLSFFDFLRADAATPASHRPSLRIFSFIHFRHRAFLLRCHLAESSLLRARRCRQLHFHRPFRRFRLIFRFHF